MGFPGYEPSNAGVWDGGVVENGVGGGDSLDGVGIGRDAAGPLYSM